MKAGSSTAVVAAVGGNALVMISKFVAYYFTGSGAMLSEGIHSVADVLNQVLLLVGIWLSGRAADEEHPYGHQPERFIWALIALKPRVLNNGRTGSGIRSTILCRRYCPFGSGSFHTSIAISCPGGGGAPGTLSSTSPLSPSTVIV